MNPVESRGFGGLGGRFRLGRKSIIYKSFCETLANHGTCKIGKLSFVAGADIPRKYLC